MIYIFYLLIGAHINPAVSIAMLSLRSITPLQCITYIISRMYLKNISILIVEFTFVFLEFIGAFLAGGLVFGTYYDAINRFDGGVRQVKILFFFP